MLRAGHEIALPTLWQLIMTCLVTGIGTRHYNIMLVYRLVATSHIYLQVVAPSQTVSHKLNTAVT